MTTRQTKYTNGIRSVPQPKAAGQVCSVLVEYDLAIGKGPALVAATDRVEIFILPAGCIVCDMILMGVAGSALTVNVGLMSGEAGDPDVANARTVGAEYFSAASINAVTTRMSLDTGFKQAVSDKDRGIGVTVSGDLALGAGRYIRLKIDYASSLL